MTLSQYCRSMAHLGRLPTVIEREIFRLGREYDGHWLEKAMSFHGLQVSVFPAAKSPSRWFRGAHVSDGIIHLPSSFNWDMWERSSIAVLAHEAVHVMQYNRYSWWERWRTNMLARLKMFFRPSLRYHSINRFEAEAEGFQKFVTNKKIGYTSDRLKQTMEGLMNERDEWEQRLSERLGVRASEL